MSTGRAALSRMLMRGCIALGALGALMLALGGLRLLAWSLSPLAASTPVSYVGLALVQYGAVASWLAILCGILGFALDSWNDHGVGQS